VTLPEQPEREPDPAAGETVLSETTVTVQRSPRIYNFMILGAVLGVLVALILTIAFPENERFGPAQVFGFLLLVAVPVGVAVASVVALILGRIAGRRATTVVADRLGGHSRDADMTAGTPVLDAEFRSLAPGETPAGETPAGQTPPGATPPGATPSSTTSEKSE
jgi:hypothetical protein